MTTLRDEAIAEIRKLPAAERDALDYPLRPEQVAQMKRRSEPSGAAPWSS
ncbi:hypothetical protein V5F59_16915 [Xanthobacter autotrophicus DSM 431]